jgi:membrane protein
MNDPTAGSAPGPDDGEQRSRTARVRARVEPRVEQSRQFLDSARQRSVIVDITVKAAVRFSDVKGSVLSGFLAYRIFLLVLPLVVIAVALAGFDDATTEAATSHLKLGQALADTIAEAGKQAGTGRMALLITGLFALAVTAWGMLSGLQYVSAQIWRIPVLKFPGKARSFLRLIGSLVLFGVVLYVAAVVRNAGIVAGLAGSLTTLASTFVGFMGLGWILPRRSKEWFWLLPGAAVGAVGQLLLQLLGSYYLVRLLGNASATYGALGIVVAALSYLYIIGLLLVLAPIANATVWEHYEDDPPGLLRRIADRIPIPSTAFGVGYVGEGDAVTLTDPLLGPGRTVGGGGNSA